MPKTYSQNVEQWHRDSYSDAVKMVAMQTRDPFAGRVIDTPAKGAAQSASDMIDDGEYAYGEERARRNIEIPVTGHRRWLVRPPVIKSGQYFDIEDDLDGSVVATSAKVRKHTIRVVRGKADRTLGIRKEDGRFVVADGGILGYAVEGKRASTKKSLPASQYVTHASTGLTLPKIREAKLWLRANDFGVEDDDEIYCAITAWQEDDLIGIAAQVVENQSAFSIDVLREGKPQRLLGITWVMTNRLPVNDAEHRLLPMWTKNNIERGIWQDVNGDLWNDTSADNRPYCRAQAYIDSVRHEDKGVIAIECVEPAQ
ncbi:MAG: phage capsid protein [Pararhodobacter sp.]